MPTVLAQSSEAGPHQRSFGQTHSLQLPRPSSSALQQVSSLNLPPLGPLQALPPASSTQPSSSPSSASLVTYYPDTHSNLLSLQSRQSLHPAVAASASPKRQHLQLIPPAANHLPPGAPSRSLLLSDYSSSHHSYQSPRTSVGWDSRATSPLYLVPQSEVSQASQGAQAAQIARFTYLQQLFQNTSPSSAALLLSPALSQVTSEAAFLDMDPRLLRRQDDPIEDIEWASWTSGRKFYLTYLFRFIFSRKSFDKLENRITRRGQLRKCSTTMFAP
jgi:hypothetical protein